MTPVEVENKVESWLSSLLKMLQHSIQRSIATAAADVSDERLRMTDFLHNNLVQVTVVK